MLRGFAFAALLVWPVAAFASGYDDFNTGVNLYNRHEYPTAVQYFSRALSAPDLPDHLKYTAHLDLGTSYELQKNFDLAIREYSVAILLKPHELLAYLSRARAYDRLGRFDDAADDRTRALRERQSLADVYMDRGLDYQSSNRFDQADADFNTFLTIFPDSALAQFDLGVSQWSQGHFDKAKERFDQSLKQDKTFAYAALWRAFLVDPDDKFDLASESGKLDRAKWPWPIVSFYLGKSSQEETLQAASNGSADAIDGQKCEADFYIAERLISRKNFDGARPLLADAGSRCPQEYPERNAAGIALKSIAASVKP